MEDGKHAFASDLLLKFILNLSLFIAKKMFSLCYLVFVHIYFTKMKRLQLYAALIFSFFVIDWPGLLRYVDELFF